MQFGLWGYSFDYSRVKLDSTMLTSTSKPIHPNSYSFSAKGCHQVKTAESIQHVDYIPSLPHLQSRISRQFFFSGFHLCLNLVHCVCQNRVYMQYMCPRTKLH